MLAQFAARARISSGSVARRAAVIATGCVTARIVGLCFSIDLRFAMIAYSGSTVLTRPSWDRLTVVLLERVVFITGARGLGSVACFAQVVVARLWAGIVAACKVQFCVAYVAGRPASICTVASWLSFVRELHSMA